MESTKNKLMLHQIQNKMKIVAIDEPTGSRTGTIEDLTMTEVSKILGFKPNISSTDKTEYEWAFKANGKLCGIWDYKDSYKKKRKFSTHGPHKIFAELFGDNYNEGCS